MGKNTIDGPVRKPYAEARKDIAEHVLAAGDARAKRDDYIIAREALLRVTTEYSTHVGDLAYDYLFENGKDDELLSRKSDIANQLISALNSDDVLKAVPAFFVALNKAEAELKQHRDPEWQRYVKNALICAGILLTGILPGLIALAVYVNTDIVKPSSLKNYSFWKPSGENVVDALNQYKGVVREDMPDTEAPKSAR